MSNLVLTLSTTLELLSVYLLYTRYAILTPSNIIENTKVLE